MQKYITAIYSLPMRQPDFYFFRFKFATTADED
jgi:hypothetical protein